ncbi:hypothetical protein [Phenylobacterium sp.]|uniref:hypothetical protein n=1 Tax=Phenylobacterium sp. TaxID=1871053 RepID=UPI00272EEF29|nr:hypothetical protein [Phenylobacterium sp.]MDP1874820.1 hypothetical protein [Phenylobacterium sp.]
MSHSHVSESPGGGQLSAEAAALIEEQLCTSIPDGAGRVAHHNIVQRRLKAVGDRLGYEARLEHHVPIGCRGDAGRVDLVWESADGRRRVAFEVGSYRRRGSAAKLLHMATTHQPVWVLIGPTSPPR